MIIYHWELQTGAEMYSQGLAGILASQHRCLNISSNTTCFLVRISLPKVISKLSVISSNYRNADLNVQMYIKHACYFLGWLNFKDWNDYIDKRKPQASFRTKTSGGRCFPLSNLMFYPQKNKDRKNEEWRKLGCSVILLRLNKLPG